MCRCGWCYVKRRKVSRPDNAGFEAPQWLNVAAIRHDSQCIQAGAWLQKWQAAPKTRSEFERWADFKLSFKWSFWQPVCFALVTKMEWIRMDRYWTSRNCASSEGLGFAWPNAALQRHAKTFKIFGSDGWEIVWPGSRNTTHFCMLWRAQTLITVGPQVYVTKIDDKPATKKESNKCAWVTRQYTQTAVLVLTQTPLLQALWTQNLSLWCYKATQLLAPTGGSDQGTFFHARRRVA